MSIQVRAQALRGKVAVITGASRGIGAAIAERFAAEGAKVALVGRPEGARRTDIEGTLEQTLGRVRALGGDGMALRFDISDPECDKRQYIAQAEKALGRAPDILVHGAAAAREWGPDGFTAFADMPFERFM